MLLGPLSTPKPPPTAAAADVESSLLGQFGRLRIVADFHDEYIPVPVIVIDAHLSISSNVF